MLCLSTDYIRNYTHSKIELPSQKGGGGGRIQEGVHIEFRSKGGGGGGAHPLHPPPPSGSNPALDTMECT